MRLTTFLLAGLIIISVSCGKDDDEKSKYELLYDKTWYNINGYGDGTNNFSSNGTFMFQPSGLSGTYYWSSADTMSLEYNNGNDQKFYFKTIEEDYMKYWPTNEPEGTYYEYSTTEP